MSLGTAVPVDVLAFGPHPDDVELGCGGTLAALAARGRSVGILDLTRGEMATRGTPETRAREAAEAARLLGALFRADLDLGDGDLRTDRAAELPVIEAVRRARPRLVLAPLARGPAPRPRARRPPRNRRRVLRGPRAARDRPPAHRPEQVVFYPAYVSCADVPRRRLGGVRDEARGDPRVPEPVLRPRKSRAPETYISSNSEGSRRARAPREARERGVRGRFVSTAPPPLADPAAAFGGFEGAKP